MDYIELTIDINPRNPWSEILLVELADNGYESFVDTETGIIAYAPISSVDKQNPVKNTMLELSNDQFQAHWILKVIPAQNWNAIWESDFQPVQVEDYATILAPFHDVKSAHGMLIKIMPKMSFGTGHHQTTWMMTKALFELDKIPEKVLDMGSGTGVLAIIASKLGANQVVAVDIEAWSVENTIENATQNDCKNIKAIHGDIEVVENQKFDLILANINKNVLKRHMSSYDDVLENNGTLLISGFFETDVDELLNTSMLYNLQQIQVYKKDSWAAIKFLKKLL